MGWYDTNSYRPDANIAKQIGGGGFGSLMTNLGGGFQKLYQDSETKRKFNEEQKVRVDNAAYNKANSIINGKRFDLDKMKYNDLLVDNKRILDKSKFDDDSKYSADISFVHKYKPDALFPDASTYNKYANDSRSAIAGQLDTVKGGIIAKQEADALVKKQAFELAKSYAGKKSSSFTSTPMNGSDGNTYNVTQNKFGQRVDADTGLPIPKVITTWKQPAYNFEDEQKFKAHVSAEYDKQLSVLGSTGLGYTVDALTGGDMNEHKKLMKDTFLTEMMRNRGNPNYTTVDGMQKALGDDYDLVGGQFQLSQKGKAKNLINNKISSGSFTRDDIAQYYINKGENKSVAEIDKKYINLVKTNLTKTMTEMTTKMYNDKAGLNDSGFKRSGNVVSEFGNSIMDKLKKVGFLPEDATGYGGVSYKDKSEASDKRNTNWEIGNQQINAPALATEIAMYVAPTWGLSPVQVGSRVLNALATGVKFGSADYALASLYGEENPLTVAALSGGAGSIIGLMVSKGLKFTNPKTKAAYNNYAKQYNVTVSKGNSPVSTGGSPSGATNAGKIDGGTLLLPYIQ